MHKSDSVVDGKPSQGNKENSIPQKRFGPRASLTNKQKSELKQAFGEFDPRGAGLIDTRNYVVSLRAMGFEPNNAEINRHIEQVTGVRGKDVIDFKDYYQMMSNKMLEDAKKSELVRMFKVFYDEDKGVITLDKLKLIAEELEESIAGDELKEMISFANASGNVEGVTLEDFMTMMERPQLE